MNAMTVVVAAFLALVGLFIWKLRQIFTFWGDKGVPYLTLWQYLRVVYEMYTKPLHEVIRKNYEHYGRLYGSYQGIVPTLVVGDPDILADVFVKDFKSFSDRTEAQMIGTDIWKKSILNLSGEEWKHARGILSPAFTANQLRKTVVKIHKVSDRMTTRLAEYAKNKKPVAINEVFGDWAVDTMAALVYSIDLDSRNEPSHPMMICFEKLFSRIKSWQMMMMFTMPRIYKLCQPQFLTKENTEPLKHFVSHIIQERQKKDNKDDDIMQLFIDAGFEKGPGDKNVHANDDYSHGKPMTLDDITAQAMLFFGAGTDTVSSAMTYSAYLLALNPECQERVLKEVDDAVQKDGITYDTLKAMPYLEASIKEAMRMYTADAFIMRLCTEETTVAGVPFKPGMNIDIPFVGIHYDPEFFPDPETFKPERFLPQNKDNIRPFTNLAFGAGPRNCVGMRLAMVQAKVALASMLRHFKFHACPETMVSVRFQPRHMIPQTDGPLMLRLVMRNESE